MQKGPLRQGTRFFKLHGAGNDLLVVAAEEMPRNKAAFVRAICHRQLGVGSDQLAELLSKKPLAIQIWNQDGTKAEMCANGSRTFLYLAARQGWLDRAAARVPLRVSGAPYEGRRIRPGHYELSLGVPEIGAPGTLALGRERVPFVPVRTGNPHAVVWMAGPGAWKAPRDFDYRKLGPRMETHPRFPKKTNVEFLRSLRVTGPVAEVGVEAWERGAGATLSCGSGAVAVAAVVRRRFGVREVRVRMTDFELRIRFEGDSAFLSGPCALVAEGSFFAGKESGESLEA
jgi:diaminopimelate epimerase